MTFPDSALIAAHATALARWQQPFAGYASGFDQRTCDQALLTLFHGGLEHAARYDWLNAGRRLIDKTYVDMLWHVQDLTNLRVSRPEQIAASLDHFITETIKPRWDELPKLTHDAKRDLTVAWVEQMAGECFGSVHSELAASRLMFFLLPTLPVFNLSRGHWLALKRMGHQPDNDTYRAFTQAMAAAYAQNRPALAALAVPPVSVADPGQRALLNSLLVQTDWWARRVFDATLRGAMADADAAGLFACNDAGGFT